MCQAVQGGGESLENNDLNQVADQRFSLKQWFDAMLILAGSENLVNVIVIRGFRK